MQTSKTYRKILFENTGGNKKNELNKQAKQLAYVNKVSLQNLDNQSACFLLENNLLKYYKTLKELSSNEEFNENGPVFETYLDSIDFQTKINTGCLKNGFCCETSETAIEKDFEQFITSFKKSAQGSGLKIEKSQTNFQSLNLPSKNASTSNLGPANFFRTAAEDLSFQNEKKFSASSNGSGGGLRKSLGSRRNVNSKFISPIFGSNSNEEITRSKSNEEEMEITDERLKHIEPKMVELIRSEIMDCGTLVQWDDIAGLEYAKSAIKEIVVWPMLRPDIFTGLRRPPKGILLFGPPGTGKTLIGKCVASQSKSTFFSISASSLTSKWIGDGEKMVRALFAVARCHQPAVIFIDEIDSLLTQRSDTEHESSRRIKTEFLVQLDGATTDGEERLLVIGATNRPQELDEAARRRFVKRLYIPLPEYQGRLELLQKLILKENHSINDEEFREIARLSDGYSGADIRNLCSEASLGPIRCLNMSLIEKIQANDVRPLIMEDFTNALDRVKSSVSPQDLVRYIEWNQIYGSGGI